MSSANIVQQLIEMGFSQSRAEQALKNCGANAAAAIEWIISHNEDTAAAADDNNTEPPSSSSESQPATVTTSGNTTNTQEETTATAALVAKSIKCDECGKLFTSQQDVEYHSAKSGHTNMSESTEEKKALSEDEKKEQLAKIESKLRQRRLEREEREKLEALDRERNRIKSGKEMLEAKKKHEEHEIQKMLDLKKREKEEDRLAKQRVRDQIEQDKLARKAKLAGGEKSEEQVKPVVAAVPVVVNKPPQNYSNVRLQIRLPNGSQLQQAFGAKEPLSAVRLYIELNCTELPQPFVLMTPFPKKVFAFDDYDKPLELLGLAPSSVLVVSKS